MISLFEIGVNIVEMFIVLSFLTRYFGSKYDGIKSICGFLLGLIVAVATITYLNSMYIYEAFLGLVFIVIYFLYCVIFLKGDIYNKLFISGFINCIVYYIALLSTLCVSIITDGHIERLYILSAERVVSIVSGKIVLVIACLILLKYRFNYAAKRRNMVLLISMPIIAELSMVGIMQIFLKYSEVKMELLLASTGVMLASVLTYYVFIKINKDIKMETEIIVLKQQQENDAKYARDIEELYSKVQGTRHDLILHFSAISSLLASGPDKVLTYINRVFDQLGESKTLIKTGNDCFDAIVNAKLAACEHLGIHTQARVMKDSPNYLSDNEIAVLFGNLFDNAIEASKNSERKIIRLDVQLQDAYLSIFMKNSIDRSVLENNKELYTTKEDKEYHGFGVKNIKRIVDEYNGFLNYYEEKGYFICDILIPI